MGMPFGMNLVSIPIITGRAHVEVGAAEFVFVSDGPERSAQQEPPENPKKNLDLRFFQ